MLREAVANAPRPQPGADSGVARALRAGGPQADARHPVRPNPATRPFGVPVRNSRLLLLLLLGVSAGAQAAGTFTVLPAPGVRVTKMSPNGQYLVGTYFGEDGSTVGYIWRASDQSSHVLTEMNNVLGVNNLGVVAGSVPVDGGSLFGGLDLGATGTIGMPPTLLTAPLEANANGYDIADDGTVVGLSFDVGYTQDHTKAFVWTPSQGMQVLATTNPYTYSRANAISSDGSVIVGWNDGDFGRAGVIWRNRVPFDVQDEVGGRVGEATTVSGNGRFVGGGFYLDPLGNYGAWRWSEKSGVRVIPNMEYVFAISDDGKTAIGSSSFFEGRVSRIWRQGVGTVDLAQYLVDNAVTGVPADFYLVGGFTALSADGRRMAGWGYDGQFAVQSFVIDVVEERILGDSFEDRFQPPPPPEE